MKNLVFETIVKIVESFDTIKGEESVNKLAEILTSAVEPICESNKGLQAELSKVPNKIERTRMETSLDCIGEFYVMVSSTDCDMVSTTRTSKFTSIEEFEAWREDAYEWAEVRMTIEVITKFEYDEFEPSTRDRIMEAYENGNGRSIYV